MIKKVLITGAGGMIGSHMVDYFFGKPSYRIVGTFYRPTIDINEIRNKADLMECDIRYYEEVHKIIFEFKPDFIFHLAAQSYPTVSWERPQGTIETNVIGTTNLFEAIKLLRKIDDTYDPIVIVACSSAEYGFIRKEEVPIKENRQLLPLHPYGVSKVAQDLLTYQYYVNFGIKGIRARIFNTTGPRKRNDVCADFTLRAVKSEKGITPPVLKVGNLKTKRAITDVRDLIQALVLLSKNGQYGEVYNISGSKVYQMGEIVDIIRKYLKINFTVEVDKNLLRPTDEPIIYGDSSKLIKDTGWRQEYDLETTIKDMIQYWRNKL